MDVLAGLTHDMTHTRSVPRQVTKDRGEGEGQIRGKKEGASRDLPGSPVVKTSPSNTGGDGLNRDWGA